MHISSNAFNYPMIHNCSSWHYLYHPVKPAKKKQVPFEKFSFLKKSITNKPVFFTWFNKVSISIFLLIYFHHSSIVDSQKLIKSCNLRHLTWLAFIHLFLNKLINWICLSFLLSYTCHDFKSNLTQC